MGQNKRFYQLIGNSVALLACSTLAGCFDGGMQGAQQLAVQSPGAFPTSTPTPGLSTSYRPTTTSTTCTASSQRSCQTGNGAGSQTCNASGSAWGACRNITTCNSGYSLQKGACVALVFPPSSPDRLPVGSDYVFTDLGDWGANPNSTDAWYGLNGYKPVAPVMASYIRNNGRAQLESMRVAGQENLSILIWFMEVPNTSGTYGHVVDSSAAHLRPEHRDNLIRLLLDMQGLGFKKINVRFAAQGASAPENWSAWNETLYQEDWNFIDTTRQIVYANKGSLKVEFDLGAELAGIGDGVSMGYSTGLVATYAKRLLSDYAYTHGTDDTYGFSIAWDNDGQRLTSLIQLYWSLGLQFREAAIDIYDYEKEGLSKMANILASFGLSNAGVILQEVCYNDRTVATAVTSAMASGWLNIKEMYQWPVARGSSTWVTVPKDIFQYRGMSTISSLGLGCSDLHCIWLVGANFPVNSTIIIFAEDWANGSTPMATITAPGRQTSSLITFRIPDNVYYSTSAINVLVYDNDFGAWSDPRHIEIR